MKLTPEQIAKRMTYDPVFAVGENVRDMMAAHIAHAIKAERARCADIANLYVSQARPAGDENVGDCPLTAHFDGQRLVAQNIEHDIRNGN